MKLKDACRIAETLDGVAFQRHAQAIGHPEDVWRVLRIERVHAWDATVWSNIGETWGLLLVNVATKRYAHSSNVDDFNHIPLRLKVE